MTDYRAPSQQWAECEEWAKSQTIGATDACVLELRSRVEALEARENSRQQDEDVEFAFASTYELGSSTQRLIDEFEEGGNVPQGIAKVLRHLACVYDVYDECLHGVRVSTLEDFADKLEALPNN
jgi:ABC-type Na+ transport system ATPase subunit NatA